MKLNYLNIILSLELNWIFFVEALGWYLCETKKFNLNQNGGDMRDRTADPLLAKQVLSQLSYTPIFPLRLKTLKIKQRLLQIDSDLGC